MADSISRATVLFRQPTFQRFFLAPGTPLANTKDFPSCTVHHTELDIVTVRSFSQSHLSLPTAYTSCPELCRCYPCSERSSTRSCAAGRALTVCWSIHLSRCSCLNFTNRPTLMKPSFRADTHPYRVNFDMPRYSDASSIVKSLLMVLPKIKERPLPSLTFHRHIRLGVFRYPPSSPLRPRLCRRRIRNALPVGASWR